MNLKELGALIKSRRESKNLTLEDISNVIKIPLKSLASIEEGDLSLIGYETYYKNFLKCYVLYLGFTYEEYQDLIAQTEDFTEQNEPPKSLETQRAETQPESTKPRGKKLALQLIILAVIGGGAYFYFTHEETKDYLVQQETITIEPTIEEQEEIINKEDTKEQEVLVEEKVTEDNEIEKVDQQDTKKQEVQDEQENLVQQKFENDTLADVKDEKKEDKKDDTQVDKKVEKQEEKQETELDSVALIKKYPSAKVINWDIVSKPREGEQQAVMYAKQDCWMQYVQDGKSSHFTLKRGTQREFIFKKSLKFKIANGSAITLFHNKKPVEIGDSTRMREVNLK